MSKNVSGGSGKANDRTGFRPFQSGYSPQQPANSANPGALPKAPIGGTGETRIAKKRADSSQKG